MSDVDDAIEWLDASEPYSGYGQAVRALRVEAAARREENVALRAEVERWKRRQSRMYDECNAEAARAGAAEAELAALREVAEAAREVLALHPKAPRGKYESPPKTPGPVDRLRAALDALPGARVKP